MPSLRETLPGYSDWLGYGHGERADAWLARLEVNRPELESFRALQSPEASPYLATPAHDAQVVARLRRVGALAAGQRLESLAPRLPR